MKKEYHPWDDTLLRTYCNYATTVTFTARVLLLLAGSVSVSKVTFWPSSRDLKPSALIAEKCTNTYSPVASLVMKP